MLLKRYLAEGITVEAAINTTKTLTIPMSGATSSTDLEAKKHVARKRVTLRQQRGAQKQEQKVASSLAARPPDVVYSEKHSYQGVAEKASSKISIAASRKKYMEKYVTRETKEQVSKLLEKVTEAVAEATDTPRRLVYEYVSKPLSEWAKNTVAQEVLKAKQRGDLLSAFGYALAGSAASFAAGALEGAASIASIKAWKETVDFIVETAKAVKEKGWKAIEEGFSQLHPFDISYIAGSIVGSTVAEAAAVSAALKGLRAVRAARVIEEVAKAEAKKLKPRKPFVKELEARVTSRVTALNPLTEARKISRLAAIGRKLAKLEAELSEKGVLVGRTALKVMKENPVETAITTAGLGLAAYGLVAGDERILGTGAALLMMPGTGVKPRRVGAKVEQLASVKPDTVILWQLRAPREVLEREYIVTKLAARAAGRRVEVKVRSIARKIGSEIRTEKVIRLKERPAKQVNAEDIGAAMRTLFDVRTIEQHARIAQKWSGGQLKMFEELAKTAEEVLNKPKASKVAKERTVARKVNDEIKLMKIVKLGERWKRPRDITPEDIGAAMKWLFEERDELRNVLKRKIRRFVVEEEAKAKPKAKNAPVLLAAEANTRFRPKVGASEELTILTFSPSSLGKRKVMGLVELDSLTPTFGLAHVPRRIRAVSRQVSRQHAISITSRDKRSALKKLDVDGLDLLVPRFELQQLHPRLKEQVLILQRRTIQTETQQRQDHELSRLDVPQRIQTPKPSMVDSLFAVPGRGGGSLDDTTDDDTRVPPNVPPLSQPNTPLFVPLANDDGSPQLGLRLGRGSRKRSVDGTGWILSGPFFPLVINSSHRYSYSEKMLPAIVDPFKTLFGF